MTQARKHRGYATQRLAADYLRRWWPNATPVGAGRTGSDVTGVPFDIEVKARTRLDLAGLMRQLRDRQGGVVGFGLLRLNGQGPAAIDDWPCVIRFADLAHLLANQNITDDLPEGLQP